MGGYAKSHTLPSLGKAFGKSRPVDGGHDGDLPGCRVPDHPEHDMAIMLKAHFL
jgi:hypothetical protein